MFEVGFSELGMVALVALLVIGPERLPKAARIAGFWLGKARNMIALVKEEISDELQAEEMRQLLAEKSAQEALQQLQSEMAGAVQSFNTSLEQLPEEFGQVGKISLEKPDVG
jgi:sec-independent protein translocase protein TatB